MYTNDTCRISNRIFIDITDTEENDDGFGSLHLDFTRPPAHWPATFEKHLSSLPDVSNLTADESSKPAICETKNQHTNSNNTSVPETQAGETYHQFQGVGHDYEKYRCAGNVTALPAQAPQDTVEVHGFQRITMMKWTDNGEPSSNSSLGSRTAVERHLKEMQNLDVADVEDLEHWAYEGIVLPGGKIMLVSATSRCPCPYPQNIDALTWVVRGDGGTRTRHRSKTSTIRTWSASTIRARGSLPGRSSSGTWTTR